MFYKNPMLLVESITRIGFSKTCNKSFVNAVDMNLENLVWDVAVTYSSWLCRSLGMRVVKIK